VMLCRCRATLNAGAMLGLCPLPQPQAPSRAAGSFTASKQTCSSLASMSVIDTEAVIEKEPNSQAELAKNSRG
ncbi:hypothetical protein NKH81_16575, partial [Mesorhizobium sp. M0959]|uniref:hypothetical protein n=1 Tax=Mesorhizobium sp. M0959 TaxID=2957034 RepID=UPI003334EDEE